MSYVCEGGTVRCMGCMCRRPRVHGERPETREEARSAGTVKNAHLGGPVDMKADEFLTPRNHTGAENGHWWDPYTVSGARCILRRHRDLVIVMLDHMTQERQRWEAGVTMLSQSPLRQHVYVAAAMKTMGLVTERPTKSGACGLLMTEKAIRQLEDLRRYL